MRIQCDTLKYATILKKKGFKSSDADGLMSTFTNIEIFNIHSKNEVNSMLSKSVEKVFAKQDEVNSMLSKSVEKVFAKQDEKLIEQRREFDARMKDISNYHDSQIRENRKELLASRRWIVGTIITVGLSLAAYLSALIHFNH